MGRGRGSISNSKGENYFSLIPRRIPHIITHPGRLRNGPAIEGSRGSIGACSVEETNGEQIDYSRPWKPRLDQCEEATLLFGQAHLSLQRARLTNRVIIYLFVTHGASDGSTRVYSPSRRRKIFYNNFSLLLLPRSGRFLSSSVPDRRCNFMQSALDGESSLERGSSPDSRVHKYDVTSINSQNLSIEQYRVSGQVSVEPLGGNATVIVGRFLCALDER